MKRLPAALLAPLAAMLLLSSCLHKGDATKFYALEPIAPSGNETIALTPTGLYQTQEMRYLTPEGEVVSIPGCRWAMPLQKLLDAALGRERTANQRPPLKANCYLNSILWKANEGFTLSCEITLIQERPAKNKKLPPNATECDVQEPRQLQVFLPCPKKPTGADLRNVVVQGMKSLLAQTQELLQQAQAQLDDQPAAQPDAE